ncbi:MAG: flagellar biosynthetic protein FliQ [Candidatus Margulisbacteria bacterium]|nr:flagellar biosynthetic protein FliQ [Candidatus Margulisiibacteriota bacterium]
MGETFIINLGRQAIWIIVLTSGPILIATLILGVVISIIQAVTQIQDMTLTFVPKFFAVLLLLTIIGGSLLNTLQGFTIYIFSSIALFAR